MLRERHLTTAATQIPRNRHRESKRKIVCVPNVGSDLERITKESGMNMYFYREGCW